MSKPLASLSLDLDNKWSYLKTHGDPGWDAYPSYLDVVVPRVLDILAARGLKITFFVVGQDAAIQSNDSVLRSIAEDGHEIGNHSFRHEPWLHLYSAEELAEELTKAEEAIAQATGSRTTGFRGPGFSFSPAVIAELTRRGYHYDASTFPTFLGPIARLYYFLSTNLSHAQRAERKQLFGKFSEGFRSLRPYKWQTDSGSLLEIPVTTMPVFKIPIHVSYLLYLGQFSGALAAAYFRTALTLCRVLRVEPSILLHPLDFLGADDEQDLAFFPAMKMPASDKVAIVERALDQLQATFEVVPMRDHAAAVQSRTRSRMPQPIGEAAASRG
jgi:hypothetical protein